MQLRALRELLAVAAVACLATAPARSDSFDARIVIRADHACAQIDPNLYGQFVEHLGRGVYEGHLVFAETYHWRDRLAPAPLPSPRVRRGVATLSVPWKSVVALTLR